MKLNRTKRPFTQVYITLTESQHYYNHGEFQLGMDYLKSRYEDYAYELSISTVFWNWWCQQMENIAKQAFFSGGFEIDDHDLNDLEKHALKDAWQFFFSNFLIEGRSPSQTVINQIIIENEKRVNHSTKNRANQAAADQSTCSV